MTMISRKMSADYVASDGAFTPAETEEFLSTENFCGRKFQRVKSIRLKFRRLLIKLGVVSHAVEPSTPQMVLAFDIRNTPQYRGRQILLHHEDQWQAYLRGECSVQILKGTIGYMFFDPYDQENMFELNDGKRRTSIVKLGDASMYVCGRQVMVECATFYSYKVGRLPIVTRIWIGNE